jgi:hypothetical protein
MGVLMLLTLGCRWCISKNIRTLLFNCVAWLVAAASLGAKAQDVQHLSITNAGGMPGAPTLTGVTLLTNGVSVTWDGPAGYYQLFEKPSSNAVKYVALGKDTNLVRHATVSLSLSNAIFRVTGPPTHYAGSKTCVECHSPVLDTVAHTLHAAAFTNAAFADAGGQTNVSCLPCHSVGAGLPTGFVSEARTPQLEGVQCENCHGPAAYHAANPDDPIFVPRVEVASTMCGGCHTIRFSEWQTSAHSQVISNLNEAGNITSCGRCHSGTARLSLIEGLAPTVGDAELGVECMSCHDPHQTNGFPAQLRYPVASTNDYFMPTNGAFLSYYNTNINVCGQCHNDRGESWTNTASAPHFSLQYNMLLGTVGQLESGMAPYQPGAHAILVTNQCVECHMQTTPFASLTPPPDLGHAFTVTNYNVCLQCHPVEPEGLAQFWQTIVSNQIQQLKLDMDFWAANSTNPAVQALFAKYGDLAWEYTTPGRLSTNGPGPNAAEQALIPTNILKARFNLYVVFSDRSLGIHNADFTVNLLDAAEDWIAEDLGQ